jgi:hypothetical protein
MLTIGDFLKYATITMTGIVVLSILVRGFVSFNDIVSYYKNDIKEYAFVVYYPTETDTLIYKSSIKVYCSVGRGYTVIGTNYRTLFKTTAPVKYINNIK